MRYGTVLNRMAVSHFRKPNHLGFYYLNGGAYANVFVMCYTAFKALRHECSHRFGIHSSTFPADYSYWSQLLSS